MKHIVTALVVMGLVVASGSAFAQTEDSENVREMNFKVGEDVAGDLAGPDGVGVDVVEHPSTESLIDVRHNFVPEIIETGNQM